MRRFVELIFFVAALAGGTLGAYALFSRPLFAQTLRVYPAVQLVKQAPRPARPRLQRAHWLAECETGLSIAAGTELGDGVTVDWIFKAHDQLAIALRRAGWRYMVGAVKLGSRESGWNVWQVAGPTGLKSLMEASPKCRHVLAYTEILGLPEAVKDWLSRRLTCYGTATWRGRTYRQWPCEWSYTGRSGSVTQLTGFAPAVSMGFEFPITPPEVP
jgi:hypothetical protein